MSDKSFASTLVGYGLAAGAILTATLPLYYYGGGGGEQIEFVRLITTSATYEQATESAPLIDCVVFGQDLTSDPGKTPGLYVQFLFGDPGLPSESWTISQPGFYTQDNSGADIWSCYPPNLTAGTYGYVAKAVYMGSQVVVGDLDGSTNGVTNAQYGQLTITPPVDPSVFLLANLYFTSPIRPDRHGYGSFYVHNNSGYSLPAMTFQIEASTPVFDNGTATKSFFNSAAISPYSTDSYSVIYLSPNAPGSFDVTLSLLEGDQTTEVKRVLSTQTVHVVTSIDPNEKIGPPGTGPGRNILLGPITYRVSFENLETALADAQFVEVEDDIDYAHIPGSVLLESYGWGDNVYTVSPPAAFFSSSHDIPGNLRVDVTGNFDTGSIPPKITWTFNTIDKGTGFPPALAGFLPPNDSTGRGEGFVTFQIIPDLATPPGTILQNEALITFDTNAPISTSDPPNSGPWFNTIADLPPESPAAPNPPDGAADVSVTINQVSCANSVGAVSYDVYFWKSSESKPAVPVSTGFAQPVLVIDTDLDPSTQYRWQIVAKNPWGDTSGPEWTFNSGASRVEDFMLMD